ncbi:Kynurenine formamidase [Sparassis crispa]|uniref:Kynurenine formamidase n=1 Tax=Sparassis crispa TaxID=139825 RepID=A0A401GIT3_9APHY|nr:Kynurenine formamidase [Sparassis crispa]GBE82015.1 Kynurenine formamidase [Sparassis crispa]
MQLHEHANISYVSAGVRYPLQTFDLYVPHSDDPAPRPLICFVHGGAWRSEDKADHAQLARRLAALTRCPVAVPNYRLTTPITPLFHPSHAADLRRFLDFLLTWPGPGPAARAPPYDPARLYLLAHSCSAHMLSSILLAPPPRSSAAYPVLAPSPALLAATRAVVLSEGLYDIDLLLHTFPAYKDSFIKKTFTDRDSYAPFNTATYALRPGAAHIRWLILHSPNDSLVDRAQSEAIYAHLHDLYQVQGQDPARAVQRNWDDLQEEHNELLAGEVYPAIVANFIADDVQK